VALLQNVLISQHLYLLSPPSPSPSLCYDAVQAKMRHLERIRSSGVINEAKDEEGKEEVCACGLSVLNRPVNSAIGGGSSQKSAANDSPPPCKNTPTPSIHLHPSASITITC
jgi:hypothetical protein